MEEAKFYEIDFSWTNPETHKNDTKSQQRAHRTEVQNERSFERELFFVLTATNKEIGLRIKFYAPSRRRGSDQTRLARPLASALVTFGFDHPWE